MLVESLATSKKPNKMPVRRIFVAVDLSEDVRRAVADHVSHIKESFPDVPVKWERPEKFHITMKFFGDTDERQLEHIDDLVASAAASVSPFTLTINGPGSFRRRDSAVLWIGVEESAGEDRDLSQLARILEGDNQPRQFHPHITIARIKNPGQARDVLVAHDRSFIAPLEFLVDRLTIYESKLLRTGSVYSVVAEHRFT